MKWINVNDRLPEIKRKDSKYYVESDPVLIYIENDKLDIFNRIEKGCRAISRDWYPNDDDIDYNDKNILDYYWFFYMNGHHVEGKVSYWMPLPDAPKKEQTHNKVGLSNQ